MIFIDFGLLRSLYCKISYLLAEEHWSHTNLGIWQPTYGSVCKDNSLINGKCRQRFFIQRLQTFILFSSQRVLHLWQMVPMTGDCSSPPTETGRRYYSSDIAGVAPLCIASWIANFKARRAQAVEYTGTQVQSFTPVRPVTPYITYRILHREKEKPIALNACSFHRQIFTDF